MCQASSPFWSAASALGISFSSAFLRAVPQQTLGAPSRPAVQAFNANAFNTKTAWPQLISICSQHAGGGAQRPGTRPSPAARKRQQGPRRRCSSGPQVVLCAAQSRGGRPCSGEPPTAPTCVGRRDGAVIPWGLHKPKSSPALFALLIELQESLHTFRAADLLIERSTVQQPPINLEVRHAPPAAPLASLLLLCCFLGQPTRCSSDAAPHSTPWMPGARCAAATGGLHA